MARETCTWCGKTLLPIADKRHGYTGTKTDWKDRQMHKRCWKERKKVIELTGMYPMSRSAADYLLSDKKYQPPPSSAPHNAAPGGPRGAVSSVAPTARAGGAPPQSQDFARP